MDLKQEKFKHFEVPDPIRIKKSLQLIYRQFGDVKNLNVLDVGVVRAELPIY